MLTGIEPAKIDLNLTQLSATAAVRWVVIYKRY